ncbi:hypothetical protein SUGI_0081850 [Cryptomeria japonica]|nr:hypothetical protein SUGI_0081850 [Cryptomeria japonica]
MKILGDVLSLLEELNSYLSNGDQSDWRNFNWALKPTILTLIHHKFLEHRCEEVRLTVSCCLSAIKIIITLVAPYNDDLLRKFLQIEEILHGLHDIKAPTSGKRAKIL